MVDRASAPPLAAPPARRSPYKKEIPRPVPPPSEVFHCTTLRMQSRPFQNTAALLSSVNCEHHCLQLVVSDRNNNTCVTKDPMLWIHRNGQFSSEFRICRACVQSVTLLKSHDPQPLTRIRQVGRF